MQSCRHWNENNEQLTCPFFWNDLYCVYGDGKFWTMTYDQIGQNNSLWYVKLYGVNCHQIQGRDIPEPHIIWAPSELFQCFFCWWLNSPRTDAYWLVIDTGPQFCRYTHATLPDRIICCRLDNWQPTCGFASDVVCSVCICKASSGSKSPRSFQVVHSSSAMCDTARIVR